jgi:hypothetical protein
MFPLKLPWPSSLAIGKVRSFVIDELDATADTKTSSSLKLLEQRGALASIAYMAVTSAAISSGRLESPNSTPSPDLRLELQHTVDSLDNSTTRGQVLADIID